MIDLTKYKYKYPVKSYVFGRRIEIRDAINKTVLLITPLKGGLMYRMFINEIMPEIARCLNNGQELEDNAESSEESKTDVAVPTEEPKKRGRKKGWRKK